MKAVADHDPASCLVSEFGGLDDDGAHFILQCTLQFIFKLLRGTVILIDLPDDDIVLWRTVLKKERYLSNYC